MITDDLKLLYSLKSELREKRKAYNDSVRGLKNSIYALELSVTKQVLEAGKTVSVGNIRAEYKPTVVIKIKREGDND